MKIWLSNHFSSMFVNPRMYSLYCVVIHTTYTLKCNDKHSFLKDVSSKQTDGIYCFVLTIKRFSFHRAYVNTSLKLHLFVIITLNNVRRIIVEQKIRHLDLIIRETGKIRIWLIHRYIYLILLLFQSNLKIFS